MKTPPPGTESLVYYFVDEAGDPVLFNRKERVIVGDEGCSRYTKHKPLTLAALENKRRGI
jgi:hypothetical protein